MREIKFRAWDEKHGKMLFCGEFAIYYENDNGFHSGKYADNGDWYELPLMQFTGLIDKTGKEIYEGDIVCQFVNKHYFVSQIGTRQGHDTNLYAIRLYDNCSVDEELDVYTFKEETARAGVWTYVTADCGVIGNIYENGDLLK